MWSTTYLLRCIRVSMTLVPHLRALWSLKVFAKILNIYFTAHRITVYYCNNMIFTMKICFELMSITSNSNCEAQRGFKRIEKWFKSQLRWRNHLKLKCWPQHGFSFLNQQGLNLGPRFQTGSKNALGTNPGTWKVTAWNKLGPWQKNLLGPVSSEPRETFIN